MNYKEVKKTLFAQCVEFVENRIETAKKAMDTAQQAANEESKSSAGDKYETTRAMMQIERDMCAKQLAEALKMKKEIDQIHIEKSTESVHQGSLVITEESNFFIAISAGKIVVNDVVFITISLSSPIGAKLNHLKTGDEFVFNNKTILIKEVV